VRGLTMMGAEFFEAGAVTLWEGPTVIEGTEAGGKIKTLFEESGLEARIASDIRMDEWVKFTTNCVVNTLTAILRVRDNEIGTPLLSEIRHGIVQECSLVAEAEGIHLGDGLEGQIDRKIKGYTNYSSMYQDIAKGKGTEIDFLNGKVVELGRKHSIRTPSNEALADLIKFLEAKK